jgi:hypothetical protein
MRTAVKCLLALALLYPLGVLASGTFFVLAYSITDSATETESRNLLSKVRDGMTPAEVESIFGRPPEVRERLKWCSANYVGCFGCEGDACDVHFRWTVRGHETGVVFQQGRVAVGRYMWPAPPEPPSAVGRLVRWFFFWWMPPLD